MNIEAILGQVPLFSELPTADLRSLSAAFTKRSYSRGQIVFHKDDEGNGLYIVGKGKLKISIPGESGDEVILAILGQGEIVGELSLIDGGSRSATVAALEDAELFYLGRQNFFKFLEPRFDAVMHILRVLTRRLREADAMLEDTHLFDITTRVARRLLTLGRQFGKSENSTIQIDLQITQNDLASMTGATRESINKQLRIFKEKGLIKIDKGQVIVLDARRLAAKAHFASPSEILT